MSITRELSEFTAKLAYEDIPSDVVKLAKLAILDTVGVIFAGAREPSSKIIVDFVKELEGLKQSTVIGQGFKAASHDAAFANRSMGHALDFDDTSTIFFDSPNEGGLHGGSPIVSAALAVAEKIGASGRDLITSVVAAYDVGARLAVSIPPQDKDEQAAALHPSGIFGTFAATAAASKLLNFDLDQTVNAFGVSVSQASGILQSLIEGSPMKRVQSGFAARNGVLSALLTKKGLIGPKEAFEGEFGFFAAYYRKNYDPDIITQKLGERFALSCNTFKVYPTCGLAHSSIDAALELVSTYSIKAQDVKNVNIWVSKEEYMYCCIPIERKYEPKTVIDAQFNIPFAVAVAIKKGEVTLDQISEKGIKDKDILNFTDKIKTFMDSKFTPHQSLMEIELTNGKKFSKRIDIEKGKPQKPASVQDIQNKFRTCTSNAISDKQTIDNIINMIDNLENIDSIISLMNTIRL